MIHEAKEIRENQTYRSAALSCIVTSAEPKDQIVIDFINSS